MQKIEADCNCGFFKTYWRKTRAMMPLAQNLKKIHYFHRIMTCTGSVRVLLVIRWVHTRP